MSTASSTGQITTELAAIPLARQSAGRPLLGLGLLGVSAAFSTALLVYFGAWAASDRAQAREQAATVGQPAASDALWEDGLLWACPLH
jgi:hypothetical protein